ncbi:MAG: hypothetical protein ACREMY_33305, partial [bacterium]
EPVRYSVSIPKFCMSSRLTVGDLGRTVAPWIEPETNLSSIPGEVDHGLWVLMAETPGTGQKGFHPREITDPLGKVLCGFHTTVFQHP